MLLCTFYYFIFLQDCRILVQATDCSVILNHLLYTVLFYKRLNSAPIEMNDKLDPDFWGVQILSRILSTVYTSLNLILSLSVDEPPQAQWSVSDKDHKNLATSPAIHINWKMCRKSQENWLSQEISSNYYLFKWEKLSEFWQLHESICPNPEEWIPYKYSF